MDFKNLPQAASDAGVLPLFLPHQSSLDRGQHISMSLHSQVIQFYYPLLSLTFYTEYMEFLNVFFVLDS